MNLEKAIEVVKNWIEETNKVFGTSSIKTETLKDLPEIFVFSMNHDDNLLGQIIVGDGIYTAYRFIAFEIVGFVDGNVENVFTWYDSESDDITDITENLNKGLSFLIQNG